VPKNLTQGYSPSMLRPDRSVQLRLHRLSETPSNREFLATLTKAELG
jgi:hypothetical protein